MKYIFRGQTIFEYLPLHKKVVQHKIHGLIPAFDFCCLINDDYKQLSLFFEKIYLHSKGDNVELLDIELN